MAAPPEKTIGDMSGKWVLERKLSTNMDKVMSLQGLSWVTIKALSIISVTEAYEQHVDEKGVTHIDVHPTVTGGFKGQDTKWIVDGVQRAVHHPEFGEMTQSSWWSDLTDVDDGYLREGWVYGEGERAGPKNLALKCSSEKAGFVLDGVWGFVDVDGKRYHARKTACKKDGKVENCTAVYSWKE
ncbi:hypothetical protein UCDDS831_g00223 [Diplodia seriata]|uniref:Lccl domain-containing protein n=1 Tax=Diplodia seriata TaxID=420778 RepID=A0A0G2GZD4_9PEZI|nr:hypothetical protein UCDDS831_g00223 [Diplodia seriata]